MAENLENQNQNQKAIGSAAARPQSRPAESSSLFVANVAEKRYLWTARAFSVIVAVSLCCNIVLLIALAKIVPLYRVEPFLLTFQDKSEQVVRVLPVSGDLREYKTVTEAMVRQYVLLRSSFIRDVSELEARWMPGGPVQEMSTASVYEEFLKRTANPAINLVKTKGLTRSVRLLSVNELGSGLWQVEYEAKDFLPNSQEPDVKYFTASIRVAYRGKTVKFQERLKNPIGFTVTRYALQQNKVN